MCKSVVNFGFSIKRCIKILTYACAFRDSRFVFLQDSLEPSMVPFEKSHSFSWFDDQMCMTSTIAEHGICFYAKEIAVVGSNFGSVNRMDLVSEMLASSTNTMALGKFVSLDMRIESSEMGPLKSVSSVKRYRILGLMLTQIIHLLNILH